MTAATQPRNTIATTGGTVTRDVAANVRIFAGTLVCLAAGYATPGGTGVALVADGRAEESVDNTGGAAGATRVLVKKGIFRFSNSAGADAITRTEIGKAVFVLDDQTVARTDGSGTRAAAGRVFDVDAQGVWVTFL